MPCFTRAGMVELADVQDLGAVISVKDFCGALVNCIPFDGGPGHTHCRVFALWSADLKFLYFYSCKSRFEKVLDTYQKICDWYQKTEAQSKIAVFDANFPNVDITNVKKIDFVLWQTR